MFQALTTFLKIMKHNKDFNYATFKPFTAMGIGLICTAIALWIVGDQVNQNTRGKIFSFAPLAVVAVHYLLVCRGEPEPKKSEAQKSTQEILQERTNSRH